jgi:hypothetical protein
MATFLCMLLAVFLVCLMSYGLITTVKKKRIAIGARASF